jgi:hypothetical protein
VNAQATLNGDRTSTDAPVKEGTAGWHVFGDGKYVGLGRLKGTRALGGRPHHVAAWR